MCQKKISATTKFGTASKSEENVRPNFGHAIVTVLCTQVAKLCPNCSKPLFRSTGNRTYKEFEIAHIFPLNPKAHELELLKDEERLSIDPNHEHNLIPLCFSCHNIYDNPKTLEGYRDLVAKKKAIIAQQNQLEIFHQYVLEVEISEVISSLLNDSFSAQNELSYDAKKVDEKIDNSMRSLTKIKIKNDIASFYPFIKEKFAEVERSSPNKATLIAHQVKGFYLKQKTLSLGQQDVYQNTIDWFVLKLGDSSREAAGVVASFFVQNCELFE